MRERHLLSPMMENAPQFTEEVHLGAFAGRCRTLHYGNKKPISPTLGVAANLNMTNQQSKGWYWVRCFSCGDQVSILVTWALEHRCEYTQASGCDYGYFLVVASPVY